MQRNTIRHPQKQTSAFIKKRYWLLCAAVLFAACKPTIALYDQYAYTQATSLKVDLQNLVLEADTVAYDTAKPDISSVNTELQKACEYSKGRNNNSFSTQQYIILLSDAHFYKQFLQNWQAKGKENTALATDAANKIGDLMDQIIKLENGKNKPK